MLYFISCVILLPLIFSLFMEHSKSEFWRSLTAQWIKDHSLVTAVALVTAVVRVQSLAQELPHTMGAAKIFFFNLCFVAVRMQHDIYPLNKYLSAHFSIANLVTVLYNRFLEYIHLA